MRTMTDRMLMRPRELARALGVSTTTLWRMRRRGDLPDPIRISPGAVGWRADEIDEWLASRPRVGAAR